MSAIPEAPAKLRAFLATLGEPKRQEDRSDDPPWFEPGVTCEVEVQIYEYSLRLAVPKFNESDWFVVGRGLGPFRLFWRHAERHFGRELTDVEARRFGELSGISLVPWQNPQVPVSEIGDVAN